MNKPIDLYYLWNVVNSGIPGYLAIDEFYGYPYVSRGLDDKHILGELCSDPFHSWLFFHAPKDVFSYWLELESYTEFLKRINVCSGPDKGDNVRAWAEIFKYNDLGKWFSHGQTGIYDFGTSERLDEVSDYHRVSIEMILSDLSIGAELYQSISENVGEQNLNNDLIKLKPEGSSTRLVGFDQDFLIAVVVPEKYENLIKAVSLTMSL